MLILAYVLTWCLIYRKQVLATRGQNKTYFSTTACAYEAADKLVAELHAAHPELPLQNPSRIMEGFPQLDQFWFLVYKGKDIYIYIYIYIIYL